MDQERDFKGIWIPKTVWIDTRLSALDKIILAEIDSLDIGEKGCFASNKYIADFCQCSESKVAHSVSKLIEFGYLYVQKFDGRQRILKSNLSNLDCSLCKKSKADLQNLQGRLVEKARQTGRKSKADLQIKQQSNIENNILSLTRQRTQSSPGFDLNEFFEAAVYRGQESFGTETEREDSG